MLPGSGARSSALRRHGLCSSPKPPRCSMTANTVKVPVSTSLCTRCASIEKCLPFMVCSDGVWKWNCTSSRTLLPMLVMHAFGGKLTCMTRNRSSAHSLPPARNIQEQTCHHFCQCADSLHTHPQMHCNPHAAMKLRAMQMCKRTCGVPWPGLASVQRGASR